MDFITFFQQLINFAHADIMMVDAFAAFFAMDSIGFSLAFAVLFAIIISVLTGIATNRIAYKPLRQAPRISLLITAIGVSFFLENIVNVTFGGTPKSFQAPDFFEQIIKIGGTTLTPTVIIVPLITMLLLAVLLYILFKTKYGIAIRALAFDIKTVSLMGVDSNKIIMIVFIIGSALAAVSGISYPILTPYMGVMIGLKAFAAAVLGGIGSVSGEVLGGFILGFTEVVFVAILPEYGGYKDAIAFIFLILVLLFKPTGIMGINFEKSRF